METERLIVTNVVVKAIVQVAMEEGKQDALHPVVRVVDALNVQEVATQDVGLVVVVVQLLVTKTPKNITKDATVVVDLVITRARHAVDLDPAEHVMEQE